MHGASVFSGGVRYVLGIAGTREPVGRRLGENPAG